jgi:hypothetical protein
MRCKVRLVVVRMGLHGRRRHRRRRRRQMDICLLLVNDESVFNTGSESMAIPELLEAANWGTAFDVTYVYIDKKNPTFAETQGHEQWTTLPSLKSIVYC